VSSAYHRPIRFPFNERRSVEALAHLLAKGGGKLHIISLMKLVYLAERESLRRFNKPICGDCYVSMPHGPVLSQVYDFVKNEAEDFSTLCNEHMVRRGDDIVLKNACARESLCDAFAQVLDDVWAQFGHLGPWELRDHTHTLPEWKDPGTSSERIPIDTLLRALGKDEEELEAIRKDAAQDEFFRETFWVA
jgi:uncharacterized phage-associated protein